MGPNTNPNETRRPTDIADERCRLAAASANLEGSWRAWFSGDGPGENAIERIEDVGPWYALGTETIIFNNKAHLANLPLEPINQTEHGGTLPNVIVWTETDLGGTLSEDNCNAFSTGTVGLTLSKGETWTMSDVVFCAQNTAHLYCFQQ